MPPTALNCPRCLTPLARLRLGGVDTDVCEHCGGLWLDRLEVARFQNPADAFGDALVAHLSQFPMPLMDHSQRVRCPRHPAAVMRRRPFSAATPVPIDECPECGGLWLDANELAAIRRR
jgi:Zn-finger nucleic acid-binding protein